MFCWALLAITGRSKKDWQQSQWREVSRHTHNINTTINTTINTMKTLNVKVKKGSHGLGLSLIFKGRDKYSKDQTGLYISQLVPGGPAIRSGLKKEDKILMINKKSPRTIEESIDILKKSKSYIDLVVERQDRDSTKSFSEEKFHQPKG